MAASVEAQRPGKASIAATAAVIAAAKDIANLLDVDKVALGFVIREPEAPRLRGKQLRLMRRNLRARRSCLDEGYVPPHGLAELLFPISRHQHALVLKLGNPAPREPENFRQFLA